MKTLSVEAARGHHLGRMMEIDREAYAEPWEEGDFQRRGIAVVLIDPAAGVVGYLVYSRYMQRFQVERLAVHPDHLRRGFGRALLDYLKERVLRGVGRRAQILVDVSEYALNCQRFLKACGWKCVETDKGGGPRDEDVYRFVWMAEMPCSRPHVTYLHELGGEG